MKSHQPLTEKRKIKRAHGRSVVGFFRPDQKAEYATVTFYPEANDSPQAILQQCKWVVGIDQ